MSKITKLKSVIESVFDLDVDLGQDNGYCKCPNCGYEKPHIEGGIKCDEQMCPRCGTMMKAKESKNEE